MPTRRTGLLLGTAALAIAVVAGAFFLWGDPDAPSPGSGHRTPGCPGSGERVEYDRDAAKQRDYG